MKMHKCLIFVSIILNLCFQKETLAQFSYFDTGIYTSKDSLKGSLRPERTSYDVKHYDLTVEFDLENQSIKGENEITFLLSSQTEIIQVDLFSNLVVNQIKLNEQAIDFTRTFDAIFIHIGKLEVGEIHSLTIQYSGTPITANNPPWDGGFQWTTDKNGNTWVDVTCQGTGASLWWPNKDHPSDEPDSMNMNFIVPEGFEVISNGKLLSHFSNGKKSMYNWKVSYPINNYNVTFSIGKYAHFSETFHSKYKGELKCDYYVLPYNLEKAREHFKQVTDVLEAYEHYLGPYPFWEDGYALIETPHLGMEHQSAIAYGNRYMKGYLGSSIPQHMDWDYVIVHETAHEYWGNAVSTIDNAELWIHESFATYMEALFVEYHYGFNEAIHYLKLQRNHSNTYPIVGPSGVNFHDYKNLDYYFKGSWVLHTLRSAINDDDLFFDIIKTFYNENKYKNVSSKDFFDLVNKKTGDDYSSFFDQYLYHPNVPTLEYKLTERGMDLRVKYRWKSDVENFEMPVKIGTKNDYTIVNPKVGKWRTTTIKNSNLSKFQIAKELFLIDTLMIRE